MREQQRQNHRHGGGERQALDEGTARLRRLRLAGDPVRALILLCHRLFPLPSNSIIRLYSDVQCNETGRTGAACGRVHPIVRSRGHAGQVPTERQGASFQGGGQVGRSYQKLTAAQLERVGDVYVLLRDDAAEAFSLTDSGAVLWEALDHFPDAEDLAALLGEARPDLGAAKAREEVRDFLSRLVSHGLAASRSNRRVRKVPDIVAELVGGELILLSRSSRKVHLLNETGALLWEVLDGIDDSEGLKTLLAEAWPDKSPSEIEQGVETFLEDLLQLGLLEEI